ncbi:hypothetical protein HII36_09800 [Nonomuraea sp. NN258]|uniref:hypothetical protein n=1 Tax=Nonomuraea antri TaxID=2730852 RepID=UPI001568CCA3|nr:hypothetical protein [Nonomuraea antri]NRQ32129.1 hypothetical protein [Nonomuraea antri]
MVLAVVRTFTSAIRLIDALSMFRGDTRVQVLFSIDESSAFSGGIHALLATAGARVISWEEAQDLECDAVITASENVDLRHAETPVLVLPHGIGFHKMVPESRSRGERVSGLVPSRYRRGRKVWMAISHPDQREQLRELSPDAADHCVLVGDVTYDRLIASLPLREHFRHLLGIGPHQRLVLMTSTWGADSLLGRNPGLPAKALGQLPIDEYRVALVTHPNIVSWHGAFHLQQVLADADDMGLIRIPPTQGWQAALIAADCIIGDHGSVTLYGAAIDRPLLLSGASDETITGTPPDRLRTLVPVFRDDRPIKDQIAQAIEGHRTGALNEISNGMFALHGQATAELRRFTYELLKLPELDHPPSVRAVDAPTPGHTNPRSFIIHSRGNAKTGISIWRYPTRGDQRRTEMPGLYRHLACYEDEPDRLLVSNASVVARHRVSGETDAHRWISQILDHYPGSLMGVAATRNGIVSGMRDGQRILASLVDGQPDDPLLAAAVVYTCWREGRIPDGPVTVQLGTVRRPLRLVNVTPAAR